MSLKKDDWIPIRFIAEEIEVQFDRSPMLTKKPDPPSEFIWQGEKFRIVEVISRWFSYARKGRMAKNMQPENLRNASRRGSWGVGRFYFRVGTEPDRIFDLYYDRAPEEAGDRKGHWYLWREMKEAKSVE
ncbi:MAG: hypothetical protein A2Z14_11500 [Chloroflexi bacterium RBG_16_48_8]|nr:MAG: hypothetical protein A2Z14_11500 [Chloroflexi bacterium RBG_16_48_8]